jgi:NAD(P)-dependent dehydrogenase (short-subunit alcohol dehydrogenase family)
LGRSLAAEGAGNGVLTNMLLPYALTQMTTGEISDDDVRRQMTAEAVAPVLTVEESGRGKPREFGVSVDAFTDLAGGPG